MCIPTRMRILFISLWNLVKLQNIKTFFYFISDFDKIAFCSFNFSLCIQIIFFSWGGLPFSAYSYFQEELKLKQTLLSTGHNCYMIVGNLTQKLEIRLNTRRITKIPLTSQTTLFLWTDIFKITLKRTASPSNKK